VSKKAKYPTCISTKVNPFIGFDNYKSVKQSLIDKKILNHKDKMMMRSIASQCRRRPATSVFEYELHKENS